MRNSANDEKLFDVNLNSTYALGHPYIYKKCKIKAMEAHRRV
jgi:hypothetical protein